MVEPDDVVDVLVVVGAAVVVEVVVAVVYVNPFVSVPLPSPVVTTTSFAPAVLAGVTQVIDVDPTATTDVAAAPPNVTPVTPVKFAPVITTEVPPDVEPDDGETELTSGATAPEIVSVSVPSPLPLPFVARTVITCSPAGVVSSQVTYVSEGPPSSNSPTPVGGVPIICHEVGVFVASHSHCPPIPKSEETLADVTTGDGITHSRLRRDSQ